MQLKNLEINDKEIIERILGKNHSYLGWDYSFNMVWLWNAFDTTQICDMGDMALIYTRFYEQTAFFPPFVSDTALIPKAVNLIDDFCLSQGIDFEINGMTESEAKLVDTRKYDIITNRDESDYIYFTEDLINLRGKKFHSKRNFITRFKNKYSYEFRDYTDADYQKVMSLYDKWCENSREVLDFERIIIDKALKSYKELDLKIGLLEVDGNIVAFSVGAKENNELAHLFVEKGDISYEGVYQIINQLMVEKYFSDCKYINREEDMGLEGLRKAKLSYNPCIILDKYNIRRK